MATRAGFITFLRNAGFTTTVLPDASIDIDSALALSLEIVYHQIQEVSQLLYDQAVYNLSTSYLIEYATDQTGQTFFADKRKEFKINSFTQGLVQSSGDEGTNASLTVPDWANKLTFADLQMLKTPWGKMYLSIAQRTGSLWGIS